jgi:glycine/D-amino acid oxidase-like deaminating enzyme
VSRRRPWRATARVLDPTTRTGYRQTGRVAACTRAGLDAWVREHRALGEQVHTWQVLALVEVVPVTSQPNTQEAPVASGP